MENQCVTAEQLEAAWTEDIHRLAEEVAEAMNSAQPGRIIADSEELVRDAHAQFRQRLFEKALGLLQNRQEAFSPSAEWVEEQGQADDDAPNG